MGVVGGGAGGGWGGWDQPYSTAMGMCDQLLFLVSGDVQLMS